MFELKSTSKPARRAMLIGICCGDESIKKAESLLNELGELVDTMGIPAVGRMMVRLARPQAGFFVGSGKASEIVRNATEKKADVIIFDHEISPGQQRNWEAFSKLTVIDREEVILDIFARRARTREARLQVELARMEYSLPRLTRAWRHLERQAGTGFGMTGAGETQLESDRRLIRKQIDQMKSELEEVRLQRATRRKKRQRHTVPHVAIVGYTNAGKSSLFKQLTGSDVLIEDKLFATLDTTTRPMKGIDGTSILLTDTVGFVRKLPHRLVESFKATLEESVHADHLIHLLDISNKDVFEFYDTTISVLKELGVDLRRMITVFNKIDIACDPVQVASVRCRFSEALLISAQTGQGMSELRSKIFELLDRQMTKGDFLVPQSRYDLVSELYRYGTVLSQSYEADSIRLTAVLPSKMMPSYKKYLINGKNRISRNDKLLTTSAKTNG